MLNATNSWGKPERMKFDTWVHGKWCRASLKMMKTDVCG